MGFGIGLGPRLFRVRVSTRGVGISSGIGPFSVYAHSGGARRRSRSAPSAARRQVPAQTGPIYQPGDTTTTNLVGANAHDLVPTGPDEIVTQLNRAQRWILWWGWTTAAFVMLLIASVWFAIPAVVALALTVVGFARRRVLLDYEVDSDLARWFGGLANGWPSLASTRGKWRDQTSTHLHQTYHRKVNAGATNLVSRHAISIRTTTPIALKTNVTVPTLTAKRHSLMFLPDRMLVKTGRRWSDVDYSHLDVQVSRSKFIETGPVPRDGVQIGETWQYANVKGGPDRRFKNNRRIPVMLYSDVLLTSPQGLSWHLSLSRHEVAEWWARALRSRPVTPLLSAAQSPGLSAAQPDATTSLARPLPSDAAQEAQGQGDVSDRGARPVTPRAPGNDGLSQDRVRVGQTPNPTPILAPAPPPPLVAPATWASDPFRRHELRYWNGLAWTEHVANRGIAGSDPPA